jgi:YD repeat-containing protein
MIATKLFLILFFSLFLHSVAAQPSELNTHDLIGKVKRVDERRVDVKIVDGVRKEEKSNLESSMVFDERGRMTFESFEGEPDAYKRPSVSATRFTYNASENSISEDRLTGRDFGDSVIELNQYGQRIKYFFDPSNRLLKQVIMAPNKSEVMTYEYFYRTSGPPSEVVISNKGRALQFIRYKYALDEAGNWTRREAESKPVNPAHPTTFDVVYRKITYYKN